MASTILGSLEGVIVIAYVQPYLHYRMKEFVWAQKDPRARREIRERSDEIVAKCPVDTSRIVIGGISAGGSAAIDFAMNGIIPAGGFLGICPALDADEFDDDEISNARKAGLKSYIITARMTTVSSVRRQ